MKNYYKTLENAHRIRDLVHNLDLSDRNHAEKFSNYIKDIIVAHEGKVNEAYDDARGSKYGLIRKLFESEKKPKGQITIGVGFNMEADGAINEWDKVFGGKISFHDALNGQIKLSDKQVQELFNYSYESRYEKLTKTYGAYWNYLRPNEKMAIICANFNSPKLVKEGTEFKRNIINYIQTGDSTYLNYSYVELRDKSNRKKDPNIQNRRNFEAELLNSSKSAFYRKPGESFFPVKLKKVELGYTIIPLGVSKYLSGKTNPEYYIWRTMGDFRVREEHAKKDGKVFSKFLRPIPGEDKNCRCEIEELPIEFEVESNTETFKRDNQFHFICPNNGQTLQMFMRNGKSTEVYLLY